MLDILKGTLVLSLPYDKKIIEKGKKGPAVKI